IAAVVLEGPEPALVDPGPASTYPRLIEGLRTLGLSSGDLAQVFLSHIHLDHAGATGHLVAANPDLRVLVHEDGAPHLVNPERLVRSTARNFGSRSDALWGEPVPVPETAIQAWRPGMSAEIPGVEVMASPGHIDHHLAFQLESDGTLLAGDAMGILLAPQGPVHPPTPPPTLDFRAWTGTLEGWADLDVPSFVATHFGRHERFHDRRTELLEALQALEHRVAEAMARDEAGDEAARAYEAEVVARMSAQGEEERVRRYFQTFGPAIEWHGAVLHLERRARR
ncbi:MAG: MBL fold metallo-hydrolase, partial [Gemmatimonadetes bacterium]|nr:MBL fold metallo-hydrolase [Gemmatimonadota bacterium]